MGTTTANTSRETFDATKAVRSVRWQQGVPVFDADLNDMQEYVWWALERQLGIILGLDITQTSLTAGLAKFVNIADVSRAWPPDPGEFEVADGLGSYFPGSMRPYVFEDAPGNNDFSIMWGPAWVYGLFVEDWDQRTEAGLYSDLSHIITQGTVSSVPGGTTFEDDSKDFIAAEGDLHLVADAGDVGNGTSRPCRVRFLTGLEAGNEYDISAVPTGQQLTVVGPYGAGGPSAGDTYVILPNALDFVAAQDEKVWLCAWVEDIDSVEDTDLKEPTTNTEPSHRHRIRYWFRVLRDGATQPTTADWPAFSDPAPQYRENHVYWVEMATMSPTVDDTISMDEITFSTPGHHTISPLSALGSGSGIGAVSELLFTEAATHYISGNKTGAALINFRNVHPSAAGVNVAIPDGDLTLGAGTLSIDAPSSSFNALHITLGSVEFDAPSLGNDIAFQVNGAAGSALFDGLDSLNRSVRVTGGWVEIDSTLGDTNNASLFITSDAGSAWFDGQDDNQNALYVSGGRAQFTGTNVADEIISVANVDGAVVFNNSRLSDGRGISGGGSAGQLYWGGVDADEVCALFENGGVEIRDSMLTDNGAALLIEAGAGGHIKVDGENGSELGIHVTTGKVLLDGFNTAGEALEVAGGTTILSGEDGTDIGLYVTAGAARFSGSTALGDLGLEVTVGYTRLAGQNSGGITLDIDNGATVMAGDNGVDNWALQVQGNRDIDVTGTGVVTARNFHHNNPLAANAAQGNYSVGDGYVLQQFVDKDTVAAMVVAAATAGRERMLGHNGAGPLVGYVPVLLPDGVYYEQLSMRSTVLTGNAFVDCVFYKTNIASGTRTLIEQIQHTTIGNEIGTVGAVGAGEIIDNDTNVYYLYFNIDNNGDGAESAHLRDVKLKYRMNKVWNDGNDFV